jgi:putative heme-binding domain-containing protein
MTGGMDNPVDVVFTPGGERIFSCTFLQNPGGGKRDGLIHAIYGGVYGKIHEVIDDHPWTGPEVMPVLDHLGPAAACGLTRYESDVFGPAYRDNLFTCCFNLHKVIRHVLEPKGATFTTKDEDFVGSPDLDFHPTDVLDDADGSLVVVDTGGWYKLCCPTSQIGKPDVLGAVYRVRRVGAAPVDDARGRKIDWSKSTPTDLVERLDDLRPAVRRRAIEALARSGADAVPALTTVIESAPAVEARRNAVWAATRIDDASARAAVRKALGDADETVRQAAIHSISVRRDRDALPALLGQLKGTSPSNRRAAAEALGRLGEKAVIPDLLDALVRPSDRASEHSLIYAQIEIADPKGTSQGLKSSDPAVRRAAMVALDQMEGGTLHAERVARELSATDAATRDTAAWIVGRHPAWGEALVGVFRDRLGSKDLSSNGTDELARQLARFARSAPVQALLTASLDGDSVPRERRLIALRAMALSGMRETPKPWVAGLEKVIAAHDTALVRQAVTTARSLPITQAASSGLSEALRAVASKTTFPETTRLEALAAIPGGLAPIPPALFAFLRQQLEDTAPVSSRIMAADVVSRSSLSRDQFLTLANDVKAAGPLELDRLLAAFERSGDDEVGLRVVAALKGSQALASLRAETLKPHLAKFGPNVRREAEALYEILDAGAAKQKEKLDGLMATITGGDIRRGQVVFNSTKAACASCHAIGYLGGQVGPDLTRVGQIRSERDLLEAIVFPSASFVRSYEPVMVATREGKVFNGVPRKDAPDEIVLATGPNEEARIARDTIEEIRPGTVSVMPAGLDQQLTPKDLADLVAFLRACR